MFIPDPTNPEIFHITHLQNLPGILTQRGLVSDARRISQSIGNTNIGYSHIKQRRLKRQVPVAARGFLGDYVPFNFCPRSVMLYVVNKGHLNYQGGQSPIIHLVSNLAAVVAAARPWAFTDRHADVAWARYFDKPADLVHVPWGVMPKTDWRACKEERQAEFLVHELCPWATISSIVVFNTQVEAAETSHCSKWPTSRPPPGITEREIDDQLDQREPA